jgi:hypothetical protein
MVNVPLFHKIMKYVYQHPEEWDQNSWGTIGCRTSFCIAGHAAHFASEKRSDVKLIWNHKELAYVGVNGLREQVSDFAIGELDLDHDDAYTLFRTWSAWGVWRKVAELTHGEVTLKKIAAEVKAEEARHRGEDTERRTDDETDSEDTEPNLRVIMHDVATIMERVSA